MKQSETTAKLAMEPRRLPLLSPNVNIQMRINVIKSMERFVGQQLSLLRLTKEGWQPSDLLPNLADRVSYHEEIKRIQENTRGLSSELLVVLVGNMITEEALPSYQTWLNCLEGIADKTGISEDSWAQWTRGWTAEENRHGDVLNKYLYLTGRVNMRAVELTIQYLIRNGFNPQTDNDPYKGFIYTSFQERATKICHRNVAKLANDHGDPLLAKVCSLIASDEARHETAYKRFVGKMFEMDHEGAILAFAEMMKRKIIMPASRMYDGNDEDIFSHFAIAAQRIGVYTTLDYAEVIQHLVDEWNIPRLSGLSSKASEAQEYLCGLAQRHLNLAKIIEDRLSHQDRTKICFSWIFNQSI